MTGLEWSDDSLFFYVILSQSVGAFIGIPVAGKYKDSVLIFVIKNSKNLIFFLNRPCI